MADVTIGNLPPGIALGQCFVPLSDTLATVKVRVSALQVDYSNITGKPTNTVPAGFIGLWSGAANAIPAGWLLCDGANGTPNLQDRFVVGAGGAYAVDNTGGLSAVTLATAQLPVHRHTIYMGGGSSGPRSALSVDAANGASHSYVGNSQATQDAGSGASHENRPPYYALCYIMKT